MADVCKIKAGNLVFELDATDEKTLFEKLAHTQEIFDQKCGKCKSENIKFVVRTVDDNKYYTAKCLDCFAKLEFGSHKKGATLFPRRRDDENNYLADGGWLRWNKETGKSE